MNKSLVEMLEFMGEWEGNTDKVALLLSVGQYKRICKVAAQAGKEQCQNNCAWMTLATHLHHCNNCSSMGFCKKGGLLYTPAYRGLLALEQYNEYEDKPEEYKSNNCGYCAQELRLIGGREVCLYCEGDEADRVIMS